ncbi:dihydrofolate reductase [Rubripirellula amarantea]|uniref:dihydrofolate reductase n=1 Tax=Rubripirellula amarantea TaxID=2527999 RepID=UPI0021BC8358|nr:dihydrofolate reductase [Rubripirellula amarantea]
MAMTPAGVIGLNGDMPWRLSSDLRRFKKLTLGGVLIMGRKTYDSIGRPLPGRQTVVITRQDEWSADGVHRAKSPEEALEVAAELAGSAKNGAYVVGGAEIYRQLMPSCEKVFLTRVLSQVQGDTHLDLDLSGFDIVEQTRIPASDRDDVPTEFVKLRRKKSVRH